MVHVTNSASAVFPIPRMELNVTAPVATVTVTVAPVLDKRSNLVKVGVL